MCCGCHQNVQGVTQDKVKGVVDLNDLETAQIPEKNGRLLAVSTGNAVMVCVFVLHSCRAWHRSDFPGGGPAPPAGTEPKGGAKVGG